MSLELSKPTFFARFSAHSKTNQVKPRKARERQGRVGEDQGRPGKSPNAYKETRFCPPLLNSKKLVF
jgi:hypothetical protein